MFAIAGGILLAFFVLAFFREIFALLIWLVAAGIVCAIFFSIFIALST